MPIDINVISGGYDRSGFLTAVMERRSQLPNAFVAYSVPMMVEQMLTICGNQPHTIRSVRVFAHGVPGCQFIGCGNGFPTSGEHKLGLTARDQPLSNEASLYRLRGYFEQNGSVVLHGCSVADGPTGRAFLERLAHLWQVSVAGSRDVQTNSLSGDLPLSPLSGRIHQVVLNLPAHTSVHGRGSSTTFSSAYENIETPINMPNN
ncbi:MAG: DUF4347 domain-containing protein [Acidobacteriota bacterium]